MKSYLWCTGAIVTGRTRTKVYHFVLARPDFHVHLYALFSSSIHPLDMLLFVNLNLKNACQNYVYHYPSLFHTFFDL